ncbi:hypothetical protein FRB99_007552 [Tulasnella sp. 403]|nr:hypothetical protein FRB99_007552 [Tulasnella sp. 403]
MEPRSQVIKQNIDRTLSTILGVDIATNNPNDISLTKLGCDAVLSVLEDIGHMICEQRALYLRRRNAFLPVFKLPMEILQRIAFHLLYQDRLLDYFPTLGILRSISSRWKDAIDGGSLFWRTLGADTPSGWISLALKNSGSALLDVSWCTSRRSPALTQLLCHSPRWQSLSIVVSGNQLVSVKAANDMLQTSSLMLEKVTIQGGRPSTSFDQTCFPPHFAPNLRHLAIYRTSLPWSSLASRQSLTSLSLVRIHRSPPTVEQLLAILKASPFLEELEIDDVRIPRQTDTSSALQTLIQPPRLSSFALRFISPHAIHQLLDAIRAPPTCFHTVEVDHTAGSSIEGVLQRFSKRLNVLEFCDESLPPLLDIEIFSPRFRIRYAHAVQLMLHNSVLDVVEKLVICDRFMEAIPAAQLKLPTAVRLSSSIGLGFSNLVNAIGRYFTRVTHLIVPSTGVAATWTRLLSSAVATEWGSKWHFPELTHITWSNPDLHPLLRILKARCPRKAPDDSQRDGDHAVISSVVVHTSKPEDWWASFHELVPNLTIYDWDGCLWEPEVDGYNGLGG